MSADFIARGISQRSGVLGSSGNLKLDSGMVTQPTIEINDITFEITLGDGYGNFFTNPNHTGEIEQLEILGSTIKDINGSTAILYNKIPSYIYADYNNGNPKFVLTNNKSTINISNLLPVYTIGRIDSELNILDWNHIGLAPATKLVAKDIALNRFSVLSGLDIGIEGTRNIYTTAGSFVFGTSQQILPEMHSTELEKMELLSYTAGVFTTTDATQFNNTQYCNGTNMVTATTGKYLVNWVYLTGHSEEEDARIILALGDNEYETIEAAKSSPIPSYIPLVISEMSVLLGRIIVLKGAGTGIVESSKSTKFSTSAAASHKGLSDLQGGSAGNYYHADVGDVKITARASAPAGWLLCDGSPVSRETYKDLFEAIGVVYGIGNGTTTFNIPNLKGKVPVGLDSSQTEFNSLGKTGGSKTHTLTIDEMPAHYHTITDNYGVQNLEATFNNGTACDETERTENTSTVGGGLAHNNLQPYFTVNYIIKF